MQHAERELVSSVQLCDQKGQLNPAAIGFARQPIIESNMSGHFLRKKKWNSWIVFGEEILFSVTISNLDYAVVCSVYFLDYETQRFFEKTVTLSLGRKVHLPDHVLETIKFHNNEMSIQLLYIQNETHISVTISDFDSDVLHADLHVEHPVHDESLNVVVPWNRQLFQLTSKHHTLPTNGFVKLGDKRYLFNPDESYAVLDYSRGILPREGNKNWGMASQNVGHQRIGLNFGGKWTDGTGMTENAVFVNGKMTKISEDVIFTYNPQNLKERWTIHTKFTETVNLTFTPFFERKSLNKSKLFRAELQQVVGYYNGTIRLQNGTVLHIQQMLGFVDEHIAKW